MAIGIDEIDDLDDLDFDEQEDEVVDQNYDESEDEENDDQYESNYEPENENVIHKLLVDNGVDPNSIKFENEEGEIESKSWEELDHEEQVNILSGFKQKTPINDYLNEEEILLINQIRENKMSPSEYINYLYQQGVNNVQENLQPQHTYQIDDLTDEDIYLLDLQSKIEGITDEELADALELAKQNPELFEKQTNALRQQYKNIEDQHLLQQQQELEQEKQEQLTLYKQSIANEIQEFSNVGDLAVNIEPEDAEEIMEFIIGQDGAGVNHFYKALNDPATVVRMAWFALKGDDVFDSISDYMSQQIKKVSRSQYQKGLEDGRKGVQPSRSSRVSVKKNYRDTREINSIDDID